MAWDVFGWKATATDYSRGEPPPAHSHEWAGIPQSAADVMAKGHSAPAKKSESAPAPKKDRRPWLWGLAGFVAGLLTGSWGRED